MCKHDSVVTSCIISDVEPRVRSSASRDPSRLIQVLFNFLETLTTSAPELTAERRPPLLSRVARAPEVHQYFFLQPLQHDNDGYFTLQKVPAPCPAPLNFLPKNQFSQNSDNFELTLHIARSHWQPLPPFPLVSPYPPTSPPAAQMHACRCMLHNASMQMHAPS